MQYMLWYSYASTSLVYTLLCLIVGGSVIGRGEVRNIIHNSKNGGWDYNYWVGLESHRSYVEWWGGGGGDNLKKMRGEGNWRREISLFFM